MDFRLTEEQLMVQQLTKDFREKELEPIAAEIDRTGRFPHDLRKKMAELGLVEMTVPVEYGGPGMDCLTACLVFEELGYTLPALILELETAGARLTRFGNEEQKKKYLPTLCKGETIGSWSFTESATGSDPRLIKTTAIPNGDYYVINGEKRFCSNGNKPGPIMLFAKDENGKITLFVFDKFLPGYSHSKPYELMGLRGMEDVDVYYDNVRIHKSCLVGEKGNAFKMLTTGEPNTRIYQSAVCVGLGRRCIDEAIKYAKERPNRKEGNIANLLNIQYLLAEMEARNAACKALAYQLAAKFDSGAEVTVDAATARLFVTTATVEISEMAMQVFGAYATTKDFVIERLYRDAKMFKLWGGSQEILRTIVANNLINK